MSQLSVSIIIVNYNTFDLTSNCIRSILSIERDLSFEIILVDNNSTECEPEEFKKIFPQIILIKSPVNVGFAKGNNLGISRSKGDYVLLLNSDTILLNKAITLTLQFLLANPNVGVVTARLENPDGSPQHNCQRFPSINYKLFELFRLQFFFGKVNAGKILLGSFFSYDAVAYSDWVWGTFFMFNRKLLSHLPQGKLSDDFFMYVEDVQWCMDFKGMGYKIAFLPTARVLHLMGGSGAKKDEMMRTNMNLFLKRYGRTKRTLMNLIDVLLQLRFR